MGQSSTAMADPEKTADQPDKPWVLVVDDSRVVRRALIRILGTDFNITEAQDGWEAWRALMYDSRVELIISDIQMPNLDGYNLICKIRAADDPGLRDIPIVVITSAEDDTTRDRAYACGANDFILKPFNSVQLNKCLTNHLKNYRASEVATQTVSQQAVKVPKSNVTELLVPTTNEGDIDDVMDHFDTGLNILKNLKTTTIAPKALVLSLRLLPLIKYCNTRFNLGLDREITSVHEKLAAVRDQEDTPANEN